MLEWLVLLLGIPAGYFIAWLAKDELKVGRKWFVILMGVSVIAGVWFWFVGLKVESFSLGFIFVVSFVSWVKSRGGKIIRKR